MRPPVQDAALDNAVRRRQRGVQALRAARAEAGAGAGPAAGRCIVSDILIVAAGVVYLGAWAFLIFTFPSPADYLKKDEKDQKP